MTGDKGRTRYLRSVALGALRRIRGWTERELAQAAGVSRNLVSHYESGVRCPSQKVLEKLSKAMGFGPMEVACVLFGLSEVAPPAPSRGSLAQGELWEVRKEAAQIGLRQALSAEDRLLQEAVVHRYQVERARAASYLRTLLAVPPRDREAFLSRPRGCQTWAVVERLCTESERAASSAPRAACSLAELAVRAAEKAYEGRKGEPLIRSFAWSFLGNARRTASDLEGAAEAFRLAKRAWKAVERSGPSPLAEWYIFSLEGSFRRDELQWDKASTLYGVALPLAPPEKRVSVLASLAANQILQGEAFEALELLQEAEGTVSLGGDARLKFAVRYNQTAALEASGQADRAARLIPSVHELAIDLRNELDVVRTLWLQARIQRSMGRAPDALASLEQVRRGFRERGLTQDWLSVTLEKASLSLEVSDRSQVDSLLREVTPVARSWTHGPRFLDQLSRQARSQPDREVANLARLVGRGLGEEADAERRRGRQKDP